MTKTYHEITKEIERLQKEADKLRDKETDEVATKIREAIQVYGFTVADLFGSGKRAPKTGASRKNASGPRAAKGAKAKRPAVPVKFKDDQGNTWSGRGKRPGWFKAALEAGKTQQDLLA